MASVTHMRTGWTNWDSFIDAKRYKKNDTVNINNRHKYKFVCSILHRRCARIWLLLPYFDSLSSASTIASILIVTRVLKGVRLKVADNIWFHLGSPFLRLSHFSLLTDREKNRKECTYTESRSTRNHLVFLCLLTLWKIRNEMNKVLLNIQEWIILL